MTLVCGLTGGIASGKSLVSQWFQEAGIPVIDTDAIARSVCDVGQPALLKIRETFGSDYLTLDGRLNRKKLAWLLFHDSEAQAKINAIVHPYVAQETLKTLETLKPDHPLIVIDVPLLFEAGFDRYVDETVVVYTTQKVQLQRLMSRDQIDEAYAKKKIAAQWPLTQKKARATYVINNSKSIIETKKAFNSVLDVLKEKAHVMVRNHR